MSEASPLEKNESTPYDVAYNCIREELDRGVIELPLLPQVASEVLASTLDDKANALRLASLIEKDQGLATHILRTVNSPAFRGSAEIVALKQAIARLGMERIREIALTISLRGSLLTSGVFEEKIEDAWTSGLRTALWAKEIARKSRKNVEVAYLCGLLHNVGVAVVINRLRNLNPGALSDLAVNKLIAALAADAGKTLVEQWQLPESVSDCLVEEENDSNRDLLMVLAASKEIAIWHADDDLDEEDVLMEDAIQYLNFYPDDVTELVELAPTIAEMVEGMTR
ncbi:MAG: HDOD domain-containing protein [Pseudomonadales bacterium]|nr:HDOD domain-containing protein [Pseudomonadales bacterium]